MDEQGVLHSYTTSSIILYTSTDKIAFMGVLWCRQNIMKPRSIQDLQESYWGGKRQAHTQVVDSSNIVLTWDTELAFYTPEDLAKAVFTFGLGNSTIC